MIEESVMNQMRRDIARMSAIVEKQEKLEVDLIQAKNGGIVWERRLKDMCVPKDLEFGGIKVRNMQEVSVICEMFRSIQGLREKELDELKAE